MIRYNLLMVLVTVCTCVFAQGKTNQQYLDEYDLRIQKEKIDRIYIPMNLEDAHKEMDRLMDSEAKEAFKKLSDAESARKYHFVFGRWLIKNWSLDRGSRLSAYLREKGIYRPDDMAKFIIRTYHRKLHKRPLMEESLLADIALSNAAEKEKRSKYKKVLSSEKRTIKQ